MLNSRNWLQIGTLSIFSSAAICCAVLAINLLAQDETIAKAGIATLTFNFTDIFTDIHLPNPSIKPRAIPDLIQPFQTEAQSAVSALTAAIPAAASKVQSGISAAASNINEIKAWIPRNCSFGTKQFCVGFQAHNMTCNDLPFNISGIIPKDAPEDVARFISHKFQSLQPLEGILAKVTFATLRVYLTLGLVCVALLTVMFFYLILSVFTLYLKFLICLLAIFICVAFAIPAGLLYNAQSKIQELESIVGIKKGGINGQFLGIIICASVIILLIFISVFKGRGTSS